MKKRREEYIIVEIQGVVNSQEDGRCTILDSIQREVIFDKKLSF